MSTLSQIAAALEALRRRERRILSARAALSGVACGLLLWSAIALAVVRRVEPGVILALSAVALVGGGGGLGIWFVRRWKVSGDPVRQARAVEALDASIRGRLVLAAERPDGPRGQESASLLERAAGKALTALDHVDPREVHPSSSLSRAAGAAVGALALLLVLAAVLPLGPIDALLSLFSGPEVESTSAQESPQPEPGRALVGEITLRYDYPDYTGLPSETVENTNGTAHGPPGTIVTVQARTAEVYDGASLQIDERPPETAILSEGRDIETGFVIEANGVYRFVLRRGEVEELSPDYIIEAEEDLPPTVDVDAARDRMEISWDEVIPLSWSARDDYGVEEVSVRVNGGEPIQLRAPLDPESSLKGFLAKTPDELGLKPGDRATLEIEARDNDAVSGSKAGQSRKIEIVVLGPRGEARRTLKLRRELRDTLVDVLAGFVTDPTPPATRQRELVAWGEQVSGRFEPLDALVDEYWDAVDSSSLEGLIVEEIRRLGGGMLRFVQSAAEPRSAEPVDPRDLETVEGLRAELVTQLESAILMLDKMVRYQALGELNQAAVEVAQTATVAEEQAQADAPAGELLSRLSVLNRQQSRLSQAAEAYDGGQLTEFVLRALEDAGYIEARAREHLAAGEMEQAKARLRDLGEAMRRMADGVEYMRRQAEEEGEEMENQLEALIEEMERLEAEERELVERTQRALDQHGGAQSELVSAWERLGALSEEMTGQLDQAVEQLGETGSSLWSARAEAAAEQAARLQQAIQARDLQGAALESTRARLRVEQAQRTFQFTSDVPAGAARSVSAASERARQIDELLRRLDQQMNTASPELMAAARGLSRDQQALTPPTEAVTGEARALAPELPMGAPGLVESLEGALREMARSEGALGQGRAVEARGAEEAAADRIRQAIEALSQASSALQQMQEAMQQSEPGHGSEGGAAEPRDGEDLSHQEIDIPPPEAFETPEAYRKALLEGMQADVPPEFEALKRRYYEELVRQ